MEFQLINKKMSNERIHKMRKVQLPAISTKRRQPQISKQKQDSPKTANIHTATFSSLQLRQLMSCEGIKLGTRLNQSVEKRRKKKLELPDRSDALIKLFEAQTVGVNCTDLRKNNFFSRQSKIFQNPQDNKGKIPIIGEQQVVLGRQKREGIYGFYKPDSSYVCLYPYEEPVFQPLPHPHLLQSIGVVQFEGIQLDGAKPQKYHLVKQYDSQTLRSFINEFGRMENRMVREYLRQVVRAVMHLHKNGLTHNRLTLESVLHDGAGKVLVNGFKSCKRLPNEQEREKILYYFPPQTLLSRNYVESEKNDVWGIGCIALQMECNKQLKNSALHPYNRHAVSFGDEGKEMIEKVQQMIQSKKAAANVVYNLQEETRGISVLGLEFISMCLTLNIERRASTQQLLSHPYLTLS